MRRFEFSEGTSDKFWQIDLSGNSFTVTWGKIGTNGQTQTKSFDTPQKALAEHDKLVKAKVNKGYTEVRGGSTNAPVTAAPATPASTPATSMAKPAAPPSAAPARAGSPTVDRKPVILTAGTAWTEDAKREVAPRRGSDFAPLRKGGGGSALSRIREAFKQAAAALDRGALRPDAEVALVTAAREAFGDRVPDLNREVDVQAAAYALIGPRLHWSERARSTDFIHYWNEVEGPIFALRALARAAEFKVFFGDVGEGQELAIINDPDVTVDVPPFREQDDETWRTMRHIVLAVGEVERAALEKIAVELRAKTDLWTRTLLTCALERSDWAKEDLEEGVAAAPRYGPGPWCWPLVLLLSFDQAETYFDRMGPSAWALLRGFEPLRFDLVATFGTDIAPRFIKAMTEGSAGIENRRAIAEALALMVTDDVVSFFLANLASNDLRAVARSYLVRHADASAVALAQAATGKGPVADAARAVLRGVVASRPDVIGRAKAEAPPAARAILEALEADTAPRAEADIAELPRVLRDLPWTRKSALPPKILKGLVPIASEESIEWAAGKREEAARRTGWLAPQPDARSHILALIDEANEANVVSKLSWLRQRSSIFAQLPDDDAVKAFNEASFAKFSWGYYGTVEILVARFGLAVMPGLLRFAEMDLGGAIVAARHVKSSRVAPLMAEAVARLKKSRETAAEWLRTFPEVAAIGLVPIAVGEAGSARRFAEIGLRFLASHGHRAVVEDVAKRTGGDEALEATRAVLDFDALLLVPKKIPALPPFFIAAAFSRPLLVGGKKALPLASVEALGTMLTFTSWDEPYCGLVEVKAACDPKSLADFAWDLFHAWLVAGASSKESWGFLALGLLGDDDAARKLTPLIRAWPGETAHARAVLGLEVLAKIGTDVALMHLHGIAQKVKFKGLQEKAREKIDQIAEARGLSAEELADRLVPDLGLDDDGTLWLDFGPRKFKVIFDESLRPAVVDESGKRVPDLPKAKQSDDPEKAIASMETWKALKKDAKAIAQGQILRLELAMCSQRQWSGDVFRTFFLEHPLLVHLVRRLVWGVCDSGGKLIGTFRVAEDSSLANADDDAYELPADVKVAIVHRFDLCEDLAGKWGQVLADYEILQPFEQLSRGISTPTDRERALEALDRVKGLTLPTGRVLGLDARGWMRGQPQDAGIVHWYEKPVQGGLTVSLELDPGIFSGMASESPEQTLGAVTVSREGGGWYAREKRLPFGALPPIVFSELVRDLESLRG